MLYCNISVIIIILLSYIDEYTVHCSSFVQLAATTWLLKLPWVTHPMKKKVSITSYTCITHYFSTLSIYTCIYIYTCNNHYLRTHQYCCIIHVRLQIVAVKKIQEVLTREQAAVATQLWNNEDKNTDVPSSNQGAVATKQGIRGKRAALLNSFQRGALDLVCSKRFVMIQGPPGLWIHVFSAQIYICGVLFSMMLSPLVQLMSV